MFVRFRNALGLAVLLAFLTSLTVFAKGQFSFLTIAGPGIEDEIRTTDSRLTSEFFAFADFYRSRVDVPADPGEGYTITRYYVDGNREIAFDQLHYFPDTGFVFYDGIVNGESEYDGDWYAAEPEIKLVFESALPTASIAKSPTIQTDKRKGSVEQVQPVAKAEGSQLVVPVVILSSLLILLLIAARQRTSAFK